MNEVITTDYDSWRSMENEGKRVLLIDLTGNIETVRGAIKYKQETILSEINMRNPDVVIPFCGCADDHSAKVLAYNLRVAGVNNVYVLINGKESVDKFYKNSM